MTSTTNNDATSPTPNPPAEAEGTQPARQSRWGTAAWCAHWFLRMIVAGYFLIYGWSKVFLQQMSTIDYPESLITVGEKSPMGILWTWMAYSPVIQISSGAIEVLVGLLLLWRRTTALGAMLGVASGFIVWTFNMTYDVPVKGLSGLLTVLSAVILIPWLPRVFRFLTGRSFGDAVLPNAVPWRKLDRITRFFPALAAVCAIALPFAAQPHVFPESAKSDDVNEFAGVWRVDSDSLGASETLSGDSRWSQIAFGTRPVRGTSTSSPEAGPHTGTVAVREVGGALWIGTYDVEPTRAPGPEPDSAESTIHIVLDAPLGGDNTLGRPLDDGGDADSPSPDVIEESFTASTRGDELTLGGKRKLHATKDSEGEYLFDRGFSWSGQPVNR